MGKNNLDLSWADAITSAAVFTLSIFMGGWLESLGYAASGPGFFSTLLSVALMFFAAFALGDIASSVYWRYRGEKRVDITVSGEMQVVLVMAFGFLSLGILFSILKEVRNPYLSHALAVLVGSVFGFSFGAEVKTERAESRTGQILRNRAFFDHSLHDNLPYALLLFLYLFPLDFLLERSVRNGLVAIPSLGALIVTYVYLSVRLVSKGMGSIEIRLKNDPATFLVVSALSMGSMFGFIYWDMTATRELGLESASPWMKIFVLFFFGLVPVRLVPLLFLKMKPTARILSFLSLTYYVVRKIQLLS